jgi:very-short-patch-repair endonuclease
VSPRLSGLDGVFVGSHAIGEGVLTPRQLRDRGYRRLLHGVYALPEAIVDHQLYCRAAALLLPDGAVIGGRSAACWHGAPWAGPGDPVTILAPRDCKWQGPRGVRVHRTDLSRQEWEMRDEVPVTTAPRTAWDVAVLESAATAVGTLDAMVRAGSASLSDLQGMALAGTGRWRITRVRRAVELVDARSESPPESWVRVAMVQAGLEGFVPQFEIVENGVFLGRVDFAWPAAKLILEYEGAYHFDGVQIVRDDERLRRLVAAGWHVIRIGAADLRNLPALIERIRRALDGTIEAS